MKNEVDIRDDYCFFFYGETCFSNFYPCKINNERHTFCSSEQYYMYLKACFFFDTEIAKQILESKTPREAKKLGRKVKGFDEVKWDIVREKIMYEVVYEKFRQNEELRNELLSKKYDGLYFVEASPWDKIWGIGCDYRQSPKSEWGLNLLGLTLNKVRNQLILEQ